jgi:hypothetical protein
MKMTSPPMARHGLPGALWRLRLGDGRLRARSHCHFAPPSIRLIPDLLRYSVPLSLKRQCDRNLGRRSVRSLVRFGRRGCCDRRAAGEKDRRVGPEVGPTSAFYRCVPTGTHGPTCIFWANLTAFSRCSSTGAGPRPRRTSWSVG